VTEFPEKGFTPLKKIVSSLTLKFGAMLVFDHPGMTTRDFCWRFLNCSSFYQQSDMHFLRTQCSLEESELCVRIGRFKILGIRLIANLEIIIERCSSFLVRIEVSHYFRLMSFDCFEVVRDRITMYLEDLRDSVVRHATQMEIEHDRPTSLNTFSADEGISIDIYASRPLS
jgi:hypothetical protein